MKQVPCVAGYCMHVPRDTLRKIGGTVCNVNPTDRGWIPDNGDRVFYLSHEKRGRKTYTWYYLIRKGGNGMFLRILSVDGVSSELQVVSKNKVPNLLHVSAEWIQKNESPALV